MSWFRSAWTSSKSGWVLLACLFAGSPMIGEDLYLEELLPQFHFTSIEVFVNHGLATMTFATLPP